MTEKLLVIRASALLARAVSRARDVTLLNDVDVVNDVVDVQSTSLTRDVRRNDVIRRHLVTLASRVRSIDPGYP